MRTIVLFITLTATVAQTSEAPSEKHSKKAPIFSPKISLMQKAAEKARQFKQYNEDKQDARRETRKA